MTNAPTGCRSSTISRDGSTSVSCQSSRRRSLRRRVIRSGWIRRSEGGNAASQSVVDQPRRLPLATISQRHLIAGGGLMRIRKLGVVGAGTMGGGIAALAVSAGIPVVLLDVPADGKDRSAVARGGLERAKKSKPAAFMDIDRAAAIEIGN